MSASQPTRPAVGVVMKVCCGVGSPRSTHEQANAWFRRVSPVAAHSGDRLLSEPTEVLCHQLRTARRRFDGVAGQAVACACSVAGGVAWSLPSRSWIRPARIWRCTAMPIWFGRSLGHAR